MIITAKELVAHLEPETVIAKLRELDALKLKVARDKEAEEFAASAAFATLMLIGWVGCKLFGHTATLGEAVVVTGSYAALHLAALLFNDATSN